MPRPQTALEFLDASYRQNAAATPNAEFRSVLVTRGLYNAIVDELGRMDRFVNPINHNQQYMFRGATIQLDNNRAEWRVMGWQWHDQAVARAIRAPIARPVFAEMEPAETYPEEEVWDVTFD